MTLQFRADVDLRPYNTFGMAVRAAHFCQLDDAADLPALLAHPLYRQGPVLWLGGGSNLLLTRDYPGLVVKVALAGIRLLREDGDDMIVEAAAGENWHGFVQHALAQGWYGLENLSLIPGTVGASPVQNIGAYGVEVKDRLLEVVCAQLDRNGEAATLSNAECRFGYRDSVFKHEAAGRLLVTAVRFRLSRRAELRTGYGDIQQQLQADGVDRPTPQDVSRAVVAIRQSKLPDPAVLGNAGSFFKNPVVPRNRPPRCWNATRSCRATRRRRQGQAGRRLADRPMRTQGLPRRRRRRARQTSAGAGQPRPRHRRTDARAGAQGAADREREIRRGAGTGTADPVSAPARPRNAMSLESK
ncbi:UDP-N-acetylenolpyruvoylglucosamine reductase [Chromobacterium violaceum]|uniref:UDP-N-acetylenolpyruvoylglucosamine reductase n=1 Tax=Chromobacterium violaceum TaxID=536 RepID=A0A3S4LIT2_CHRVL|nr:UDP-N-acetylenolpyruvoylglucosamine reductase [Chromobacterium violaceum]